MDNNEKSGLKREIGAGALAINAMNLTIGTGIFVLPAYVAGYLGSMSFLAFLFCSLLMGLIMLCFAELGSNPNSSGGAYGIIQGAFGPLAGFVANTLFWFGYAILSSAAILNAMSDMLTIWFPIFNQFWFRAIFIFCVIGIFVLINVRGVKSGSSMVVMLTVLKLTPLILLIVIGVFGINGENFVMTSMPDVSTLGAACLLLFFAFGGSESALNINGEIKNPGRTIPRGIFIGITGILVIYLLLQLVATGVLGSELANYTDAPLAETAIRLVGPIGGTILGATAIISMYGVIAGDILATSRLPFIASQNGQLPALIGRVHPRYKSPYVAILLYGIVMFVVAISGGFKTLAILSSSAILIIYLGVVLAMIKSRLKPNNQNPPLFRVKGGLLVPSLALAVLIWVLSYVPMKDFIAMAIFFLVVAIFFFAFRKWKQSKQID